MLPFKQKQKTEAQAIFHNLFTICHCANRNLLFVCLLAKKQTRNLQTD